MSIFNRGSRKPCRLTVLGAVLLIPTVLLIPAIATAEVRTTTRVGPPNPFGAAIDGRLFADDPLIGLEVVETRVYWDIVVADRQDAASIFADVFLPIDTNSGSFAVIDLDGRTLGWSGSGTLNHFEVTDRYNGFFAQAGSGFGAQSWGLPPDAVDILPTSRIEIDYVVPDPGTIDFRRALTPRGNPSPPIPPASFAIDPPAPTTADTIFFTVPLDGEVYSNDCYAAAALRGRPVLDINEGDRVINILFDGIFSGMCPMIYDPVTGVWGNFGTLAAGDWTLYNSHGGSLDFTVEPDPSTFILHSIASGDWGAADAWDGDGRIPTADDQVLVGSHSVTVTADAVAKSLQITEADGKLIVDAGAVLDLTEGLSMAAESHLGIGVAGTTPGKITAGGAVSVRGNLELTVDGVAPFAATPLEAGSYSLIRTTQPDGLEGTFGSLVGLGKYATLDDLSYSGEEVTLHLTMSINPGDLNLDTHTDVRDFNIWNANKFTSDTSWATGDFNGDGTTDVRDFNIWNTNKFTSAAVGIPLAGGQVPEPSTMALLAIGLTFASVGWRRRRRRNQ